MRPADQKALATSSRESVYFNPNEVVKRHTKVDRNGRAHLRAVLPDVQSSNLMEYPTSWPRVTSISSATL